jgi:phosphatidylglycerol:prolipoprotein diacylglycerol transferase
MTPYVHDIDPIALQLGPIAIHWYGLMYLAGFIAGWFLGRSRIRAGRLPVSEKSYGDLMFYAMLGVILGGRLGYILFYDFGDFLRNPTMIVRVWEGGMSFHGGLLGVLLAGWWWSRANRLHFFDTVDFVAPLVPPGLFFGRMGNFIGGELWGRTTDVSWAVVFPHAPGVPNLPVDELRKLAESGALEGLARHPSQLYQAGLEGIAMFVLLWWFSSKPRPRYAVSGLFAILYGVFRIAAEFVRQPDVDIGFLAGGWLTMGMLLSLPMILFGLGLLWLSRSAPTLAAASPPDIAGKPA